MQAADITNSISGANSIENDVQPVFVNRNDVYVDGSYEKSVNVRRRAAALPAGVTGGCLDETIASCVFQQGEPTMFLEGTPFLEMFDDVTSANKGYYVGTSSFDGDNSFASPKFVGCDAGYALVLDTSSKYRCRALPDYCPLGWVTNRVGFGVYCTQCEAGVRYNDDVRRTGNCQLAGCAAGTFVQTPCTRYAPHVCQTCSTCQNLSPRGVHMSEATHCFVENGEYDYDKCFAYNLIKQTCGNAIPGSYSTRDNQCIKIDDLQDEAVTSYFANHHLVLVQMRTGVFAAYTRCVRTAQAITRRTGDSFVYIRECERTHMYIASCAGPPDPAGFYYPECASQLATEKIGPGTGLVCNLPDNVREGEYASACTFTGLEYKSCETEATSCEEGTFRVLCGYHRDSADVSWGVYEENGTMVRTPPDMTNINAIDNRKGNIGFRGQCIACSEWRDALARREATAKGRQNLFLLDCGVYPGLVDKTTWIGVHSGEVQYCHEVSNTKPHCESTPSGNWYIDCASAPRLITSEATFNTDMERFFQCIPCEACTQAGLSRQHCGVDSAGQCTACVAPPELGYVSYIPTRDGRPCVWRCEPGQTGLLCDTDVLDGGVCSQSSYSEPALGPRQSYCASCRGVVPLYAVQGPPVLSGELARWGGLDILVQADAGDDRRATLDNPDGQARYIGQYAMDETEQITLDVAGTLREQGTGTPLAFLEIEGSGGEISLHLEAHSQARGAYEVTFDMYTEETVAMHYDMVNSGSRWSPDADPIILTRTKEWHTVSHVLVPSFGGDDNVAPGQRQIILVFEPTALLRLDNISVHAVQYFDTWLTDRVITNEEDGRWSFDFRTAPEVPWLTVRFRFDIDQDVLETVQLRLLSTQGREQYVKTFTGGAEHVLETAFANLGGRNTKYGFELLATRVSGTAANITVRLLNIQFWERRGSCPWTCAQWHRRVGEACLYCKDDASTCAIGTRRVACTVDGYNAASLCQTCTGKPNDSVYVANPECDWACNTGFWKDTDGGVCQPCTGDPCGVGQTRGPCTEGGDAECVACDAIASMTQGQEHARYTTENSCDFLCNAGYYRYEQNCLQCTPLDCQARALFHLEIPCSDFADGRCEPCPAPPQHAHVTGSGPPGDTQCPWDCAPSYVACRPCLPGMTGEYHGISIADAWDAMRPGTGTSVVLDGLAQYNYTVDDISEYGATVHVLLATTNYIKWETADQMLRFTPDRSDDGVRLAVIVHTREILDIWIRYDAWSLAPLAHSLVSTPDASRSITFNGFARTIQFPQAPRGQYGIEVVQSDAIRLFSRQQLLLRSLEVRVRPLLECSKCPATGSCVACSAEGVPANAVTLPSADEEGRCRWQCAADYREDPPGECRYCPLTACPVGQYESDCGECAACSVPENRVVTGPGRTRFADSCPTQCGAQYYEVQGGCVPCSAPQCTEGEYLLPCTPQSNARCARCTVCAAGSSQTSPCASTADAVCEPCPNVRPPGASWVTACEWACVDPTASNASYVLNTDAVRCQFCEPNCAIGEFATACGTGNGWTGCEPCVVPTGSRAITAGVGTPTSCLWVCPAPTVAVRTGSEGWRCAAPSTPPPAPAVCDLSCRVGYYLVPMRCQCRPCPNTLPEHAVWLTSFRTAAECEWACLAPYSRDNRGRACVRIRGVDENSAAAADTPPPRRTQEATPELRVSVLGPMILLSLVVVLVAVCARTRVHRAPRAAWRLARRVRRLLARRR